MIEKLVEKWAPLHNESFALRHYTLMNEEDNPHFVMLRMHDEYEITFLENCSGKRFIGNSMENFSDGDLFIIGPRLQHGIRPDKGSAGSCTTLHFHGDTYGPAFFNMPECEPIQQLLVEAEMGVAFNSDTGCEARKYFARLLEAGGFERILAFLDLMNFLATRTFRRQLSSRVYAPVVNQKDYDTVNLAYQFIINRFRDEKISLEDISSHLNMSPATFCRYFKKHFRKTFTAFLNEVRVGHACKLLQSTDRNIAEVAYSSGYRQLTHFNRQFKRIIGCTPRQYRGELAFSRG